MTTESIKAVLESKGIIQRWVAPPLLALEDDASDALMANVELLERDLAGLVEVQVGY